MPKNQIDLVDGEQQIEKQEPNQGPEGNSKEDNYITDFQARELLNYVDIVRDPIHHDIRLTAFERQLIDTEEFQRLKNINQLATTHIAYPGADELLKCRSS